MQQVEVEQVIGSCIAAALQEDPDAFRSAVQRMAELDPLKAMQLMLGVVIRTLPSSNAASSRGQELAELGDSIDTWIATWLPSRGSEAVYEILQSADSRVSDVKVDLVVWLNLLPLVLAHVLRLRAEVPQEHLLMLLRQLKPM